MFLSKAQTYLSIKLKKSRDARNNRPSFIALDERIALRKIENMNLHGRAPTGVHKSYITAEELFKLPRRFRENRLIKKRAKYSLNLISSVKGPGSHTRIPPFARKTFNCQPPKAEIYSILGKRGSSDITSDLGDCISNSRPEKYQRVEFCRSSETCRFAWKPVTDDEIDHLRGKFDGVSITKRAAVVDAAHMAVAKMDAEVGTHTLLQKPTRRVGAKAICREQQTLHVDEEPGSYLCTALPLLSMLPWEVTLSFPAKTTDHGLNLSPRYSSFKTTCKTEVEERWFLTREQEYRLSSRKLRLISTLRGLPQGVDEGSSINSMH